MFVSIKIFLIFLALVVGLKAANAKPKDIHLEYSVFIGGLNVVNVKIGLNLDRFQYNIKANAKTAGIVQRLFPWRMEAYSKGKINGEALQPVAAGQENNWKGKNRHIHVLFKQGVPEVDRIMPQPTKDSRTKVSRVLRVGSIDLASAILGIIRDLDFTRMCSTSFKVFDGRRLYDLIVEADGTSFLKANRYTMFSGKTVNCKLSIVKRAGFKRRDNPEWNSLDQTVRVSMGRVFNGAPLLPVRMGLETPLGQLISYLKASTLESNGEKKRFGRRFGVR